MGPFKPFPPFPPYPPLRNALAGPPPPPPPYLALSEYLRDYYSPLKTEWVSGHWRRTGNAMRPYEWVPVPGYWRTSL
jgi:hypothetical protein